MSINLDGEYHNTSEEVDSGSDLCGLDEESDEGEGEDFIDRLNRKYGWDL